MTSPGLPWVWGDLPGTPAPAPHGYDGPIAARGVRVDAPTRTVWLWLRQLQVAPYSYDLLDNRGRRSPRSLTAGLTEFTPASASCRSSRSCRWRRARGSFSR